MHLYPSLSLQSVPKQAGVRHRKVVTSKDGRRRLVGIPPLSQARPKVTWMYGYTLHTAPTSSLDRDVTSSASSQSTQSFTGTQGSEGAQGTQGIQGSEGIQGTSDELKT